MLTFCLENRTMLQLASTLKTWIQKGGNNLSHSFSEGFATEDPQETVVHVFCMAAESNYTFYSPCNFSLWKRVSSCWWEWESYRNISYIRGKAQQFSVKTGHTLRECDLHTVTKIFALHAEMATASDYQRHYNVKDEVNTHLLFFYCNARWYFEILSAWIMFCCFVCVCVHVGRRCGDAVGRGDGVAHGAADGCAAPAVLPAYPWRPQCHTSLTLWLCQKRGPWKDRHGPPRWMRMGRTVTCQILTSNQLVSRTSICLLLKGYSPKIE